MRVLQTYLKENVLKSYELNIGNLHLFENLAISEINEGKHISISNTKECLGILSDFYSNDKPFGYISNRLNSFSVEAIDYSKFTNVLKNLKVFSIVKSEYSYSVNIELEKQFCKIPYTIYNNLTESYKKTDCTITKLHEELTKNIN